MNAQVLQKPWSMKCPRGCSDCSRQTIALSLGPNRAPLFIQLSLHTTIGEALDGIERWIDIWQKDRKCWMTYIGKSARLSMQESELVPLLGRPEQLISERLEEVDALPQRACHTHCQDQCGQVLADLVKTLSTRAEFVDVQYSIVMIGFTSSQAHPVSEALSALLLSSPHSLPVSSSRSPSALIDSSVAFVLNRQPTSAACQLNLMQGNPLIDIPLGSYLMTHIAWQAAPSLGIAELCSWKMIKTRRQLEHFDYLCTRIRCCYEDLAAYYESFLDQLQLSCGVRSLDPFLELLQSGLDIDEFLLAAAKQISPYSDLSVDQLVEQIGPLKKRKPKKVRTKRAPKKSQPRPPITETPPSPITETPPNPITETPPSPSTDSSTAVDSRVKMLPEQFEKLRQFALDQLRARRSDQRQ